MLGRTSDKVGCFKVCFDRDSHLLSEEETSLLMYSFSLQFDVTAVGATLCRHGHLMQLMDIQTGERYVYACILLLSLMEAGVPLHTLWYDINCKFAPYFRGWIARVAEEFQGRVGDMKFPLPEFHKYAHRYASTHFLLLHLAVALLIVDSLSFAAVLARKEIQQCS